MDVKGISEARLHAISMLRRGEFAYGDVVARGLATFMAKDFAAALIERLDACDYIRAADIIEHEWRVLVMPKEEAAKLAEQVDPQADMLAAPKRSGNPLYRRRRW